MTAEVGKTAPDFHLPITSGETKLSDYKGQYIVFTFIQRTIRQDVQRKRVTFEILTGRALEEQGAVVLGVSPDSIKKHQNFTEKFSLPFPLFADENSRSV